MPHWHYRLVLLVFLSAAQVYAQTLYNPVTGWSNPGGFSPAPTNEWLIDEGTGQEVSDSGSGANDGQLGSTSGADDADPTWITAGLDFISTGVDDYVVMGTGIQPDFDGTPHTFCTFADFDGAGGFKAILGEWDSPGWIWSNGGTGEISELLIRNTASTNELRVQFGDRTAVAGEIYFICVALATTPTTSNSDFFINAALDQGVTITSDTFSTDPSYAGTEFRMGTLQASSTPDHKLYTTVTWVGTKLTHQQIYDACDWYRDILVTQGLSASALTCVPPPTHQWDFDVDGTLTDKYGSSDCTKGAGGAAPTWLNPGFRFGKGDNFNCGDITDFANGTGYSMCAIFDKDDTTDDWIAGRSGSATEFGFLAGTEMRTNVVTTTSTNELDVASTTASLTTVTWYFGCWTIPALTASHGSTSNMYVDGAAGETLSVTTDTLSSAPTQTADFLLGETDEAGNTGLDGDLHRIAIWADHQLTQEESESLCWAWDGFHSVTLNCN